MHAETYTYRQSQYVDIHKHIHGCIYTYVCITHTRASTYIRVHVRGHARECTCTRVYVDASLCARMVMYYTCMYLDASVCACTHIPASTYIRVHVHVHASVCVCVSLQVTYELTVLLRTHHAKPPTHAISYYIY